MKGEEISKNIFLGETEAQSKKYDKSLDDDIVKIYCTCQRFCYYRSLHGFVRFIFQQ